MISQRLENVGKAPSLSRVDIRGDMGATSTASGSRAMPPVRTANSLWSGNSRYFLRGWGVGDIISVVINISDQAQFNNKTQRSRQGSDSLSVKSMFGLESVAAKLLPSSSPPSSLMNMRATDGSVGNGKIDRKEVINTMVAATVVEVLPSGNLLIKGSQEVRVNFELRDITVQGIVSPQDIGSDHSVKLEKLAEARVSYGGRGQIFELQQPAYGQQVVEAISPF